MKIDPEKWKFERVIRAKAAKAPSEQKGVWGLREGYEKGFLPQDQWRKKKNLVLALDEEDLHPSRFLQAEASSLTDIRRTMEKQRRQGYSDRASHFTLHSRRADWFAPLILLFLGMPFACRLGRKGSLVGVALALLVGLLYTVLVGVFAAFGKAGWLPPEVAAYAPLLLAWFFAMYGTLDVPT